MSTVLRVIGGIVIAIGILFGIPATIFASGVAALIFIIPTIIAGILLLAVAHMIDLLEINHYYLQELYSKARYQDPNNSTVNSSSIDRLHGYQMK